MGLGQDLTGEGGTPVAIACSPLLGLGNESRWLSDLPFDVIKTVANTFVALTLCRALF